MEKIYIYKSNKEYNKKYPFIIKKGDITASFKTKKEAENYRKVIRNAYISIDGHRVIVGNEKV